MLLRFGNVVLWLNGHIHANRVSARGDERGSGGGFWEVTTASLVDWPCQSRLVEVIDAGDGFLAIACTMVDHDATNSGGAGRAQGAHSNAGERTDLAALHRELAGNVPYSGFESGRAGSPLDRNVILPLRAPFLLSRLSAM